MDGVKSPDDPHPFRASLAVLASVLPVSNWVWLAKRRAPVRDWVLNILALCVIAAVVVVMIRVTSAFSPRPLLQLGVFRINPHALQWCVAGLGTFVVINLAQSLRRADRPTFAVISRSPSLLLCIAVGSLQTMINYGVMGFTPSFIMKSYGLSPARTG